MKQRPNKITWSNGLMLGIALIYILVSSLSWMFTEEVLQVREYMYFSDQYSVFKAIGA